ncbi:hypothetical protein V6N12_023566 [Hibiscus sabdariffa]|uniref:Uncharacterized protein n=1 Tax=Hibiscus sabdariffa TaxID=183260 RepID=A0ABR2FYF9_9ROSI
MDLNIKLHLLHVLFECRPENDIVELVWENGQVLMQGQSSRARKFPSCNSLPSHTFKTRGKDVGNGGNNTKMGKSGVMDSVLSEIPMSVPSHDDDDEDEVVPWLKYPEDQSLENECSGLLPELCGLTANGIPTCSNLASFDRKCQSIRDSFILSLNDAAGFEQGMLSKVPKPADDKARPSCGTSQSSQLCQVSSPYFRSRSLESIGTNLSHTFTDHDICRDSMGLKPPDDALPGIKTQKQDPVAPCNNTVLMNFSHFSRPAAVVKASLQNIGAKATIEKNGSEGKGIGASVSDRVDSTLICSNIELQKEEISHCHSTIVPMKTDIKESKAKSQDTPVGTEPNGATESVLAASSVCCGDNVERASDDPVDAEEEYIGVKKAIHARGGKGSKRSRAAEVHNLSERVDKASMLDEAIEYLKTLRLQVQIMSMRAALYMPLMMFPTGMQHMHAAAAAHMTHFSPMSVGMGVGMGFGMRFPQTNTAASACPMVQVSPIPGPPFSGPGPHLSGATTLHEMTGSNLHLYGLHGQGLPMSMPGAPLIPVPGEHLMKSALGLNGSGLVGPMDNKDSATASSSKDPIQNINSQVTENTNINNSVNQTSTQCRTTNESFEQPAEMQENSRASEITSSVPFKSTDGDDKFPDRS